LTTVDEQRLAASFSEHDGQSRPHGTRAHDDDIGVHPHQATIPAPPSRREINWATLAEVSGATDVIFTPYGPDLSSQWHLVCISGC
jgi:hypothetical protein